tara:strand:+ start:19047 stop:19217 length:171 start_codon:yes stop_codon:yes gene_type:complete
MISLYWYGYGWKTLEEGEGFMADALSSGDISPAENPRVVRYDAKIGIRYGIQVQHD